MTERPDPNFDPRAAANIIAGCRQLWATQWDKSPALQASESREAYVNRKDRDEIAAHLRPGASLRGEAAPRTREQLAIEFELSADLKQEFATAEDYVAFATAHQNGHVRMARSTTKSYRASDFKDERDR